METTTPRKLTKKAKIDFLRRQLAHDDAWALRALVKIYQKQTAEEKASKTTKEDNGVGFSGIDAEFLSSLAQQFQARGWLTPKQMAYLHKKIVKYAGQVLAMSDPVKLETAILKLFQNPVREVQAVLPLAA